MPEYLQKCPEPAYCVERKLLPNGERCEGHCKKECPTGKIAVAQPGLDSRGCPYEDNCEDVWEHYIDQHFTQNGSMAKPTYQLIL